jgi:hypothetical protein
MELHTMKAFESLAYNEDNMENKYRMRTKNKVYLFITKSQHIQV